MEDMSDCCSPQEKREGVFVGVNDSTKNLRASLIFSGSSSSCSVMGVMCWYSVTSARVCVCFSQDTGWVTATPWKFSVSSDTVEWLFSWCVTPDRLWACFVDWLSNENVFFMPDVSGWGNHPEQSLALFIISPSWSAEKGKVHQIQLSLV